MLILIGSGYVPDGGYTCGKLPFGYVPDARVHTVQTRIHAYLCLFYLFSIIPRPRPHVCSAWSRSLCCHLPPAAPYPKPRYRASELLPWCNVKLKRSRLHDWKSWSGSWYWNVKSWSCSWSWDLRSWSWSWSWQLWSWSWSWSCTFLSCDNTATDRQVQVSPVTEYNFTTSVIDNIFWHVRCIDIILTTSCQQSLTVRNTALLHRRTLTQKIIRSTCHVSNLMCRRLGSQMQLWHCGSGLGSSSRGCLGQVCLRARCKKITISTCHQGGA